MITVDEPQVKLAHWKENKLLGLTDGLESAYDI
jgi:hypothetical protein